MCVYVHLVRFSRRRSVKETAGKGFRFFRASATSLFVLLVTFFFFFLRFLLARNWNMPQVGLKTHIRRLACFLLLAVTRLPQVQCLAIAAYEPSCTPVPLRFLAFLFFARGTSYGGMCCQHSHCKYSGLGSLQWNSKSVLQAVFECLCPSFFFGFL